MAASFFEPRGMAAISAKYFQTSGGVSPSIARAMSILLRRTCPVGGQRANA
jgi:hypothetical protein